MSQTSRQDGIIIQTTSHADKRKEDRAELRDRIQDIQIDDGKRTHHLQETREV